MRSPLPLRHAVAAVATAGLLAGALSACGSSDDNSAPRSSAATPTTATGTTTGSGTPASPSPTGPTITAPGTGLGLNQPATLDWTAKQGVSGVLQITVTKLESTSFAQTFAGWKIPAIYESRAPYFIRATVKNVGTTQLGGFDVPLYGLDSADNLVEATSFGSDFTACQPKTLPPKFGPNAAVKVCLVVLTPDKNKLVGVSYRPDEKFDPITWKGTVQTYAPPKPKAHKGKRRKKG